MFLPVVGEENGCQENKGACRMTAVQRVKSQIARPQNVYPNNYVLADGYRLRLF